MTFVTASVHTFKVTVQIDTSRYNSVVSKKFLDRIRLLKDYKLEDYNAYLPIKLGNKTFPTDCIIVPSFNECDIILGVTFCYRNRLKLDFAAKKLKIGDENLTIFDNVEQSRSIMGCALTKNEERMIELLDDAFQIISTIRTTARMGNRITDAQIDDMDIWMFHNPAYRVVHHPKLSNSQILTMRPEAIRIAKSLAIVFIQLLLLYTLGSEQQFKDVLGIVIVVFLTSLFWCTVIASIVAMSIYFRLLNI